MGKNRAYFGDFELDRETFRLLKDGNPVPVEPKALDVLGLLVDRAPRMVEKAEIFSAIWKDVSVTDNALTRLIAQLRKALEDDPKAPRYIETVATRGYRFVADVRDSDSVIRGSVHVVAPAADAAASKIARPTTAVALFTMAAVLVVALTGYVVIRRSAAKSSPTEPLDRAALAALRPVQLTSSSGLDAFPSLSPDGLALAFSSDRSGMLQIYVQSLAPGSSATMLTSDNRQNVQPRWSPDGQFVAYHAMASDGIWIMPARGGAPRQLSSFGSAPSWSPDGRRIVFQSQPLTEITPGEGTPASLSTIWAVDVASGRTEQLTSPDTLAGVAFVPVWSPDGRRVYFSVGSRPGSPEGPRTIWSVDVGTRKMTPIVTFPQLTRYLSVTAAGDELLFGARETGLPWRLRIDPGTGRALGEPEPVGLAGTGPSSRQLTVSSDGRRFFWTAMTQTSNIWSIAVDGATGRAQSEAIALTHDSGTRATIPVTAADGRIAFTGSRPGQSGDVFLLTPDGATRQLTLGVGNETPVTWMADGREIVILDFAGQQTNVAAVDADTGRSRHLFGPLQSLLPEGAGVIGALFYEPRSGRFAIGLQQGGVANIWVGTSRGTGLTPLQQLTFERESGSYPAVSSDGRFVAYQCSEGSSVHICLVPADGGAREQLTNDTGQDWVNAWAPDNDRVLYAQRRNAVWNLAWVSRTTRRTQTVTSFTRASGFVRYPVWAVGPDRIIFERNEVTGRIWMVEIPR